MIEVPFTRTLHKDATIRLQFGISTNDEEAPTDYYDNLRFEPRSEDSDNDGLDDAWEQAHFATLLYHGDDDVDRDHFPTIAGTKPTVSDSDGDGLEDGYEMNTASTNPFTADSDDDGLTDLQELEETHSDPTRRDSDGDQLDDAEELRYGTNPREIDTDGDGFSDYHEWSTKTNGVSASDYPEKQGIPSFTEFMAANTRMLADDDG